MTRTPLSSLSTLFGALLLAAPALAGDDLEAQSSLTRPPGAPDGDASGYIRVEIDLDKNRHRLKVEAEHIDTSLVFEAWIANSGGTLTFAGVMPYDDVGEVEIEFDTKEAPPLPFGSNNVNDFAGRALEVRSGGLTYLTGTVPSLNGGGGGSGGGGSGGGAEIKVKQYLLRSATSPDSDVKGYVELRSKGAGDQKFKVEAEHVDTSVAFSVWLETAAGSGAMQQVGAMGLEDFNEVELEIETEDGATLPYGVTDVFTLAGRRVEVRDGTNAVYLEGLVPGQAGGVSGTDTAKTTLPSTVVPKGKARLKLESKKTSQRFELKVEKVKGFSSANLMVANDQGQLTLVSQIGLNGGGNGKFNADSKKGQTLPLGVLSLTTLGGRAIELRDPATGAVIAAGIVPNL